MNQAMWNVLEVAVKYVEDMKTLRGGGCSKRVADKRTSTWKRRIAAAALAAAIAVTPAPALANPVTDFLTDTGNAVMSFFGLGEPEAQAAYDETVTVDPSSVTDWNALVGDNTANIGRIWTDKTVLDDDTTLTPSNIDIKKGESDFLVALSALSSSSNVSEMADQPLDIVLVLDVSGSMNYYMDRDENAPTTTVYLEAYPESNEGTYYIEQGNGYREVSYSRNRGQWGYYSDWRFIEITPKTSASDTTEGAVQFFIRTQERVDSRMAALKTAVGGFIDATAEKNEGITDETQKHRISVVKFSGNESNNIGNDTYTSDGHTYNYTQIVKSLDYCTEENADTLKRAVNALQPNGSTRADYGMQKAQEAFNNNPREGTRKVVIFFTDGLPTSFSDWSDEVANGAVKASADLKGAETNPALVYTIGVFQDADPSNTSTDPNNRFNAYMHAVSSNYPKATAWNNLGQRVDDSKYYKAATNAEELNNIFSEIQKEITDGTGYPTVTTDGAENTTGYITFNDSLGAYMQVDDFKCIVYNNVKYENPAKSVTTDGDLETTTYTFTAEVDSGGIGNEKTNLSNIEIKVTRSETNAAEPDKVLVKIPANLIPLRKFEVDTDAGTMSIKERYPIRIFYGASLKDGVAKSLANPDAALKQYIDANEKDGKVSFYSNLYTGTNDGGRGDTTSTFEPAKNNNFYYSTVKIPVFTDESCENALKTDPVAGQTYYFKTSYYQGVGTPTIENGVEAYAKYEVVDHVVKFDGTAMSQFDGDWDYENGQVVIQSGGARISTLDALTKSKTSNETGTATEVIDPRWDDRTNPREVNVYLGNNGRLDVELPGTLTVSKTATVDAGLTVDGLNEKDFNFKLELSDANGNPLSENVEFAAQVFYGTEKRGQEFKLANNGTFTLKNGETLYVYGLSAGTKYKVTETSGPDGFEQTASSSTESSIVAGETSAASFTNTYKVGPLKVDADAYFKGNKILKGRNGASGDIFTFSLVSTSGSPMPKKDDGTPAPATASVDYGNAKEGDKVPFAFAGKIEFTAPGTYDYTITEIAPSPAIPGVTPSEATYAMRFVVRDNGAGGLELVTADNSTDRNVTQMYRTSKDDGTELGTNAEQVDSADFTNTWAAKEAGISLRAHKEYTDTSDPTGQSALTNGKFSATLSTSEADAPMPAGAAEDDDGVRSITVSNIADVFTFGNMTFDGTLVANHQTGVFIYTIREVNQGSAGMGYDATVYTVAVKASVVEDDTGDTAHIELTATYYKGDGINENNIVDSNAVVFKNTYTPTPLDLTATTALRGTKTINGRDQKAEDNESFKFTLSARNELAKQGVAQDFVIFNSDPSLDSATAEVTDAKNGEPKTFTFNSVKFTKRGIYEFSIKENVPAEDSAGMKWDRHEGVVTVTVGDDGNGSLLLTSVVYGGGSASNAFVNEYTARIDYSGVNEGLNVTKELTGRAMKADEFGFTIAAKAGVDNADEAAAMLQATDKSFNNVAAGVGFKATMKKLLNVSFDQDDAGKTFVYVVDEVDDPLNSDNSKGVTCDKSQYEVAIAVYDNGDGTMHTVTTVIQVKNAKGEDIAEANRQPVSYDSSTSAAVPTVSFTNAYVPNPIDFPADGDLNLTKVLSGRDWIDTDSFTFTVEPYSFNGDINQKDKLPTFTDVTLKKSDGAGSYEDGKPIAIKFGTVKFTEVGTYVYKVTEELPAGVDTTTRQQNGLTYSNNVAEITVFVTDPGNNGQLVARASVTNPRFENVYASSLELDDAIDFLLTKKLEGHALTKDQFDFKVTAIGDNAEDTAKKLGFLPEGTLSDEYSNPDGASDTVVEVLKGSYMKFTQADSGKTFSLKFEEIPNADSEANGYTYDKSVYNMDITPTDNADGTMKVHVKVTATGNSDFNAIDETWTVGADRVPVTLPFVNKYKAEGTLAITGKKIVESTNTDDSISAQGFKFKIEDTTVNPAGPVTLPSDPVISNKTGEFKFEGITFSKPGTYTFEVTELQEGSNNISTWAKPQTVTVIVSENNPTIGDGKLNAVIDSQNSGSLEFKNVYTANNSDPLTISVTKTVAGHNAPGAFDFYIVAAEDTKPLVENGAVVNSQGANPFDSDCSIKVSTRTDMKEGNTDTVSFTDLVFTKEGTYTFDIFEDCTAAPAGWKYDDHTHEVTVTVEDQDGKLVATQTSDDQTVNFTNSYGETVIGKDVSTSGYFTKALDGRDWLATDEFSFTLRALDGAPLRTDGLNADGTKTITVTSPGTAENDKVAFNFGTFKYSFEDIKNVPMNDKGVRSKTFYYEVTENDIDATKMPGVSKDTGKATLAITVTDDGKGEITAQAGIQAIARVSNGDFVNTYSSSLDFDGLLGGFDMSKHLDGRLVEKDQFTFTVTAEADAASGTTAAESATLLGILEDADNPGSYSAEYKTNGGGHDVSVPGPIAARDLTQDDAGKTFVYTVVEIDQAEPSYTYDKSVHTVKIAVTDDGAGVLTATTTVDGETKQVLTTGGDEQPRPVVTFNNSYTAIPVVVGEKGYVSINATKDLANLALTDGAFTFEVRDKKGNLVTTGTNDASGHIAFKDITYNLDKLNADSAEGDNKTATLEIDGVNYVYTYEYTVTEVAPASDSGITPVTGSFKIKVKVVDDEKGNLTATVVYPENSGDNLAFENIYGADASFPVQMIGAKTYDRPSGDGYNVPDITGAFTFELTGVDEAGKPAPIPGGGSTAVATNDAAGNVDFGRVVYTAADLDGAPTVDGKRTKTFTYTVAEGGSVEGVENDAAPKTFTVTLTDEGVNDEGKVVILAVASTGTGAKFSFTNEYKVTPKDSSLTGEGNFTITKKLDGRALAAEEFEFALYATDGSKVVSAKNDANGNVEFPAMTFDKPGSYEYTLKEIELTNVDNGITYDTSSYKVVAGVTDNGKGALEVKWSVFDGIEDVTSDTTIIFTNTYEATATSATFGAAKLLDGADLAKDQFTFELINKDGKVIATAKNDADGNIQFPSVELKYEGAYKFSVAEKNDGQEGVTYDDTVYGIDVVVTDDGKGHLVAEVKYEGDTAPVFKNTYTKPVDPTPEPKPEEPAKPTLPTSGDTAWAQTAIAALAAGTGLIAWGVKKRKRS